VATPVARQRRGEGANLVGRVYDGEEGEVLGLLTMKAVGSWCMG